MAPPSMNEFQSLLTVTVCPDAGRVPIVWRSAWVRAASASRGPAVAASTQPKTSTASANVATAPMPGRVRRRRARVGSAWVSSRCSAGRCSSAWSSRR
jgi:hypothetical protein